MKTKRTYFRTQGGTAVMVVALCVGMFATTFSHANAQENSLAQMIADLLEQVALLEKQLATQGSAYGNSYAGDPDFIVEEITDYVRDNGRMQKVATITVVPHDEDRYLNELTLRFENENSEVAPADVFHAMRVKNVRKTLFSDTFRNIDTSHTDYNEWELELYDASETGYGLLIPAGASPSFNFLLRPKINKDVIASEWNVLFDEIELWSPSKGNYEGTLDESGEDMLTFGQEGIVPDEPDLFAWLEDAETEVGIWGDGQDIGMFELELEIAANDDVTIKEDDLKFTVLDEDGQEAEGDVTYMVASSADEDDGQFFLDGGDDADFNLKVNFAPETDGTYRLVLHEIVYDNGARQTLTLDTTEFRTGTLQLEGTSARSTLEDSIRELLGDINDLENNNRATTNHTNQLSAQFRSQSDVRLSYRLRWEVDDVDSCSLMRNDLLIEDGITRDGTMVDYLRKRNSSRGVTYSLTCQLENGDSAETLEYSVSVPKEGDDYVVKG